MKFSQVLDALMEGKPIARDSWENKYLYFEKDTKWFVYHIGEDSELITYTLDLKSEDIIANDWDIDYWETEDNKEE